MDPIVSGATANLSSEAAKGIFKEAKRHIRYVRIYKRNVDKFEEKLNMLMAKRAGVQQEVDAAKRNAEKIKADVEDWCDRVDKKIEEEEKKVKELEDKANNKCFIGLCPNIMCRCQLSKKAEEGANTVDGLLQQGEFNRVSYRDVPEEIVDRFSKDFKAFKSREKVFNDIMEALKDATVGMIGVYGMPGVGKTTLVNEVVRHVEKEKLFDKVVVSVVNQTPDILKIQDQIADSLGLKFEEQSITGRAHRLCGRLKKEKEILVVLDDLWARLDLEEVGIPFYPERKKEVEIPCGDENKGCKIRILLTSRDLNVLTNGMDAQKNFPVCALEKEEAWDLFKEMAGDNVENPELQPTANEVAERCAGLPVALVTVGRALRNKPPFAWKDALRKLQRPSPTNFMGIPEYVYSAIELSYHHLRSPELKKTFLLCSLLGHHASIQDLLKYSVGLGLFDGVNSVEETRDGLLTVVSDLKASCVLRDSYSEDRVDMHDLICDVALAIASRDHNVFASKREGFAKNWPNGETMEKCTMISLQFADISHFPIGLTFPQLSLLYIGSKDSSVEMPASFFTEMKHLRLLDLTNLHFSIALPSSLSFLTNLRTLCLTKCVLGDIALIGELNNLEILSLLKSDIELLPKEIGQLVQLRLLDLSGCTKLKIIPPGVFSSLSRLEELYMGDSFIEWEVEKHANQQTNATLAELKLLSVLTALEIHIPDAKIMPGDLFFEHLERFKIFIGQTWKWGGEYEYSKTLRLELNRSIDHLNDGIKMLLKKTEELSIDDMKGAKIALHGLIDEEGFRHLKNLHIQNSLDIQYIIDDNRAANKIEFLQLQSLTLKSLPQLISFSCENKRCSISGSQHELPLFSEKMVFPCLEKLRLSSINAERIWHHQLPNKSFCTHENLTSLIIEGCGNLKVLLSSSVARSLVNLKNFQIIECKSLREVIVSEEEGREEVLLFPQLNSLKIKNLPNLMGFCSLDYKIDFPSLKSLKIEQCPTLKGFMYKSQRVDNQPLCPQALFDEKVAVPSLEKLRIINLRNLEMIWHNQLSVNSFCKLTEMTIQRCDELATLFPCNMWSTFQRLETLTVGSCGSLEAIFEVQSLNTEETHVVATQFRELYIYDLPKLKHVWSKDAQGILSFRNLSVVEVSGCWSLKNVFPASTAKVLQQLKDLSIQNCGVEEIVAKEEGSDTCIRFEFDQLSSLLLWDLPKLKCFYPGMHTTEWPVLKKLKAWGCQVKIFYTDMNGQQDSPKQRPSALFLLEKVITKLEEVCLKSDDIAMISDNDKFSSRHFREVKTLRVDSYHGKSAVFPIAFLERFSNLEKLELGCSDFKELFSYRGDFGMQMNVGTFLPFKALTLHDLHNVKYIWKHESRVDHFLPNLETLEVFLCGSLISLGSCLAPFQNLVALNVWRCTAMTNLVTSSSAVQSLVSLRNLEIQECASMKEIVGNERGAATDDIIFNRLTSLHLCNLPSLESFCSGNYKFEFPSLEHVTVIHCPVLEIFCKGALHAPLLRSVETTEGDLDGDLNNIVKQLYSEKAGYQGVEYLVVSDFSKSIDIWEQNLEDTLDFTNLKVLKVKDCSSLRYIFTISMAMSLVQLKEITVKNCPMMEQIIRNEEAEEATISRIMLPRLRSSTLESCSSLTSFFLGSNTLECPLLEKMTIVDCPKMFEFTSVFPRKQDMEKIGDAPFFNDKMVFPCSENLHLSSINVERIWHHQLPNKSFCPHENILTSLVIEGCGNLKVLLSSSMARSLVNLENFQIIGCKSLREVIVSEEEGREEEVLLFPQLNSLKIKNLPNLMGFCSLNYKIDFPSLKSLKIGQCPTLKGFMYKSQRVDNQPLSPQALFDEKVLCPNLDYLKLSSLNIQKIWPDQRQITSCNVQNLISFVVKGCHSLKFIFPSSLCEKLVQLDLLTISDCRNVEEVICTERLMTESQTQSIEAESTTKFVFPKITLLQLYTLPKLKCFYSRIHTTEWPLLGELRVVGCDKVEFARDFLERQGESHLEIFQQPLFWVYEDSFPNLEKLYLKANGIMEEIWHGQIPTKYFPKLKRLKLICFPKNAVALPSCFIQSLPNLEKLRVSESFINEIFQCEGLGVGDAEAHVGALARLKELRLSQLPELTDLWKDEIPLGETLGNLRILQVLGCGKLENVLVPSFVSFKNLITLEISECHGLKYLVTLQTARSMMLLERMSVIDCQKMKEIIASTTDDEVVDGIVLSKLKSLELCSLPSLSRFCSGNFTFGFPFLEELIMNQCPKLETFSEGELSTPMLQEVQSTGGESIGCWEGDLNAIIRQLFVEKVFPSIEDLEQSSINIQRIWHWKLQAISSFAQNLTCLTVEGCPNLKCLFSSSMVESFVRLKMLHIDNCENFETIIYMEGLGEGELMSQTSFRVLESLLLKDLPKLTRFCHGGYIEFPSLRFLRIQSCLTLKTSISNSVTGNGIQIYQEAEGYNLEIACPALLSEKVAFHCLEELGITVGGKWREIWHDRPTDSVTIQFAS